MGVTAERPPGLTGLLGWDPPYYHCSLLPCPLQPQQVTPAHHPSPPIVTPTHPSSPSCAPQGCSAPWAAVRLLLTHGTWAPIWGKFAPNGLNSPTWAPGSPHPSLGGSGLEWGLSQPQGSSSAHSQPSPGVRGKKYQHVLCSVCRALQGPSTLTSALGELLPERKEKKTQTQGLGRWATPLLGDPESQSSLAWARRAGKSLFTPQFSLLMFFPPQHSQRARFLESIAAGMLVPTPLSSVGQSCKSHRSVGSGGDSEGVPRTGGTRGFATLPQEPQQQLHVLRGMAVPSPGGCRGVGTPCLSPPGLLCLA